ncbi:thiamine phosphate synthase [Eubacteriales bacterium KG127]
MRKNLDISAYLVIGPENTLGRPVDEIVRAAIEGGFTCIQIRSKVASARQLIAMTGEAAKVIEEIGKANEVTLVVDDRLDVVLAARAEGIKVDGIHVGQSDIPVSICRKYLGEDAIIGLSARTDELIEYVKNVDTAEIDYFGAGPLHKTETKPDCGLSSDGVVITRSLDELRELAEISPVPVVVGGGVKLKDIPDMAETGIDGFFVVTAVSEAEDPREAAKKLVEAWHDRVKSKC